MEIFPHNYHVIINLLTLKPIPAHVQCNIMCNYIKLIPARVQ